MIKVFLLLGVLLGYYVDDPIYHTYSEVQEELDSLHSAYPEITLLDTIGFSERYGTPIIAFKISDNAGVPEAEPRVMFDGIHHAEEVLGLETIMATINDILERYSEGDTLIRKFVDELEIWFLPVLNPDGHNIVMGLTPDSAVRDTGWRKNARDNNLNGILDLDADGVDPNRNYDFNWAMGGDSVPSHYFYRGPNPFSEGETQAMKYFCERERFCALVNYHSPSYSIGEIVYYPWRWTTHIPALPPDFHIIDEVAGDMAAHIVNDNHNGHYLKTIGEAEVGNARNWQYGKLGIIALTIEICSRRCQVPPEEVPDITARNREGIYWLLSRALRSSFLLTVRDTFTDRPLSIQALVLEIDTIDTIPPPRETDPRTGSLARLLLPGTYTLELRKEGYLTKQIQFDITDDDLTRIDTYLVPENPPEPLVPYPVPSSGEVRVVLDLDEVSHVKADVYDVAGRRIRELLNGELGPGYAIVRWDGKNDRGEDAGSGVFFIKFRIRDRKKVAKTVRVKR